MDKREKRLQNNFIYTGYSLVRSYIRHGVASRSAELAYYLLFALFPLIIFVSLVLASTNIDIAQVETLLQELMPHTVSEVIVELFENIRRLNLDVLMYTGLFGAVYAMLRAVSSLGRSMSLAYNNMPIKRNALLQFFINLVVAVLLLVSVVLSLVVVMATPKLLQKVSRIFMVDTDFAALWKYIRYLLVTGMIFGAICIIYCVVPNRRIKRKRVIPGAAAATVSWALATAGFSFYVENMSSYTLIYGSVGAIIILLLYLYITSLVLIMGAELNSILMDIKLDTRDMSPIIVRRRVPKGE